MSNNLDQLYLDQIINKIIDSDDLIFTEQDHNTIIKYKLKIIDDIIDNDYIELITKLKNIYSYDLNISNIIANSVSESLNDISVDSFKWIISNEPEIILLMLNKFPLTKFLVEPKKFYTLYRTINVKKPTGINENETEINSKTNKTIRSILKNKIVDFVNNSINDNSIGSSNYYGSSPLKIWDDFEFLTIIIDEYNFVNINIKKNINDIHCKIIINLLKLGRSLTLIQKYIKYYSVPDKELKIFLEKTSGLFENIIQNGSIETICWVSEICSLVTMIKPSNYKQIFRKSCMSGDIEKTKFTYNLIECAGYKLTNYDLSSVLDSLIYQERWNKENKYENIIHEIINMDVKPPSTVPKFNDYYKKITLIKK